MPETCCVPGCKTGYKSGNSKEHLFGIPKDDERREKWRRAIPRAGDWLTKNSKVCALHFEDHFIIKFFEHNINGKIVKIPRGKTILTTDAIPSKFPGLPGYYSKRIIPKRQPKIRESPPTPPTPPSPLKPTEKTVIRVFAEPTQPTEPKRDIIPQPIVETPSPTLPNDIELPPRVNKCCKQLKHNYLRQVQRLKKKIQIKKEEILKLRQQNSILRSEEKKFKNYSSKLPERMALMFKEALTSSNCKTKNGVRYSTEWLLDAMLLRTFSPRAYDFLRRNDYLPLPSKSTLHKCLKDLPPNFGSDKLALFSNSEVEVEEAEEVPETET